MKRFFQAAAVLAAAAFAPACVAQPAATTGRHILYRVEGAQGATVYLLGSIHVLTPDVYPLPQPMQDAYADAEQVFFEVNLDSLVERQAELLPRGMLSDGRSLGDLIEPALLAQVQEAAVGGPVPAAALERMEPWLVALLLATLEYQKAGMQAQHGIDVHFEARAQEDGKALGALETVDFQMGLFDGMSMEEQVQFLRSTLENLPRTGEMLAEIVAAWRAGDAERIDALMNDDEARYPEMFNRVLRDRNALWVPQIRTLLDGRDDVLVVVGAAHLVGENSVVAMLRDAGFRVDQM